MEKSAISCGPGPSGTSSCSNRLPPLIAPAACVRAVDVHREDEGPAGEVGIDRVTLESQGTAQSLARSELLMEYLPLSAESLVGRQASWPTVDHSGSSGKLSRLNPS